MAEKQIAVRYSIKDKELVERAFKSLGDEGERFLKRLERAGKPASTSLKLIDTTSREAQNAMRGLAGQAGTAGNILSALGPKGLAAAAALGAVSLAVTKGLRAYAEDERAQLRLQAVLRATGDTAGVTAKQITELAEKLERSTFFKKEDILQAAAALATFKAVSGDAFESTIKLATDLAEIFGGDVTEKARTLAKALQDPVDGLTALKRIIGELPPDIRAMSDAYEKAGNHAQAVNVIITELQNRFGGVAQEAARGYAGEIKHLGDAFDDLLKSIGRFAAESGLVTYFVNIAHGIDAITEAIRQFKRIMADPRRAAWEDKSAAMGFVTEPTIVRGHSFDSRGNLTAPGAAPAATAAAARETTRHVKEQAKASGEAAKSAREFAVAERQAEVEARKLAEAQREALRPIEHAYERMQDMAADWLSGQKITARSFVDIWKRAAAEIAAALIFRPIFASTFGSFLPGLSGSLTGGAGGGLTGGLGAIGGAGSALSGLSSIYQLLNGGTGLNLGGSLVSAGQMLGLGGIDNAAALFSLGSKFTPLSGLSSLGGNMLANLLLGDRGIGSSIGGTIGGIGGTIFGGPIGGAVGSFLGNAIGGLFGGGGKPHPWSVFKGSLQPGGGIGNVAFDNKHIGPEFAQSLAGQFSGFLQGLTGVSSAQFGPAFIGGGKKTAGTSLFVGNSQSQELLRTFFNPNDASSTAEAFRKTALYLAQTATVVDQDLVTALTNVQTQGRDAAAVLAAITQRLGGFAEFKAFTDALGRDPSTSNESPERQRQLAAQFFGDVATKYGTGGATAQDVQAAALAYLQASQLYTGRSSGLYAQDLDTVRTRLTGTSPIVGSFASGGDFDAGVFKTHPGEIVMTSSTPGTVMNAGDTKGLLSLLASLRDEFSRYRSQSAAETMQLKNAIGAQVSEIARLSSAIQRMRLA